MTAIATHAKEMDRTPFGLADIREFRAELVRRWPSCFQRAGKRKAPLKIGIMKDLIAAGVPGSLLLRASISDYTGGLTYLRAMVEGARRVGLDGQPAGTVTAEDAEGATRQARRVGMVKAKAHRGRLDMASAGEAQEARAA
jgi:ProP effector